MLWAPLLGFLTIWCTGADSQPVPSQPPSARDSAGNTVKLPCALSTGFSISGYHVYWYQQKPGNSPRYLLRYYSDSNKNHGSGVPARFSGSKESSSNSGFLTITGVLAEDEADYYCAVWDNSNKQYIFGGGTQLSINDPSQPKVPPTINLYPPAIDEVRRSRRSPGSQEVMLVCLINGFYPADAQMSWEADGRPISSGVETTKPTKQNDFYLFSSYLTLPQADWESDNTFTCKVKHDNKSYSKSIKRSDCA